MRQPEGFEEKGKETWVCRLLKSIYGLKQAGRLWQQRLNEVLVTHMGFKRIESDSSIWVWSDGSTRIIVPVFVDDMTLASNSAQAIADTKAALRRHFKLRDLGPTSWLLGVEITRDRAKHSLSLSQRQYIVEKLAAMGWSDLSPVQTPMDPGLKLHKQMPASTPEVLR